MFTQAKFRGGYNLKFVSAILFAVTFLVGGFFISNTAFAETTIVNPIPQCTGTYNLVAPGTSANDTINGTSGDDFINAGDGDNTVNGLGGNDCIVSGIGNDIITTTTGNDIILAGDGNNTVSSGDGNDYIITGSGNDTITGGTGTNTCGADGGINTITDCELSPVAHLILTTPATSTITRSTLVPETSGTPTGGNTVVDAAINGLTAIPVTLANTGDADSANVRINPISAGAHIQLWAKDTSGNWFDINVTGWIGSAGKSILAGSSITTDVYAISDTTGDYLLTVNLVNAVGGTHITSATGTVTVAPIIHPVFIDADKDGNFDLGERSFNTIQAAIDAATAGDTIKVGAGTYTEQITVNKKLTINGSNVGISAGVNAGTRVAESTVNGGFIISKAPQYYGTPVDGTIIDGFTVLGGEGFSGHNNGFSVESSGALGITIQNNIIQNVTSPAQSEGIETVDGTDNLTIKNNNISNNWRGIYLAPASGNQIVGNIIDLNNGVGVGIGSSGQSNLTISGNIISNHTVEGFGSDNVGVNVAVHSNEFIGNTAGVDWYPYTDNGNKINATENWWNSASGPGPVGPGSGDKISVNVNFDPWYTDAGMNTLSNAPVTLNAPSVTNDDTLNTVTGMTTTMEYKLDAAEYVVYDATAFGLLDFSGAHTLLVRVAAEGINPVSADTTLTFTTNPIIPQHHTTSGSSPRTTTVAVNTPIVITPAPVGQVLGAEAYNFTLLIKNNSKGNEVIELQKYLIANGYLTGIADGSFGPKTLEGVKKFQTANSLVADGIVGPAVRGILNKALVTPATPADGSGAVSVTYNFGTTNLKNGSQGDAVQELQRFLNNTLGLKLVVDGKLGPKTIAVIKQWQGDNGLIADGIIGLKTKALMNSTFK